jgi:hypothetical protein
MSNLAGFPKRPAGIGFRQVEFAMAMRVPSLKN